MLKFAIKTKTKDSIVSVITWVKTRTNRSVSQKLFDISWQHPLRSTRQIFLALVLLGPTLIMFWVFIEHFDFHIGQEKKKKRKKMSQVTWYIICFEKYCQGFLSFFFFSVPDTESDVPSAQQFTLASSLHRLQHNQLYVLWMMSLIFPLHQVVHKHDRGIMALGNAVVWGGSY